MSKEKNDSSITSGIGWKPNYSQSARNCIEKW
jgi:hypothetical protein